MRIALVLSAHATGLLGACGMGAPGADADPGTSATAAATGEGLKTMPVRSDTIAEAAGEEAAADARNDGSDDSQCGADRLGRWLNLLPTEPVKAEIAAAVGERPIRYYTQGDPVTMDFSPARLNVELGEDGRIELFRCG